VKIGPGGFRSLLGESPKEIRNQAVPLQHFWGFEATVLLEKMCLASGLEERWDALEQALLKRVLRHGGEDPYVREAMGFMEKSGWRLPAAKLAAQLGYSDRQIRNKFEHWVGLGPREFQRVQRCRSLILRVLYGPRDKWTQMADEFGYFDQPHLSHEFKEFMGQAPEEFLHGLASGVRRVEGRTEYGRRELFVLSYPS
jgi:AraC-like DNA-binding protein